MISFDFKVFGWSVSFLVRKVVPLLETSKVWYKDKYIIVDSVEKEIEVYHENNAIARPYRSHVRGLGTLDCPGCLWMRANIDPDKYRLTTAPGINVPGKYDKFPD